jgi:hypothetical protein
MQDPIVAAWRQAVEVLKGEVRLTLEQPCEFVERAVLCRLRRAQAERQIACAMLPVGMLPTATDTLACRGAAGAAGDSSPAARPRRRSGAARRSSLPSSWRLPRLLQPPWPSSASLCCKTSSAELRIFWDYAEPRARASRGKKKLQESAARDYIHETEREPGGEGSRAGAGAGR